LVERQREIKGKISIERTLYIGSKGITSAQALANAARGHWGIENRLHWVLDVTFREDECRSASLSNVPRTVTPVVAATNATTAFFLHNEQSSSAGGFIEVPFAKSAPTSVH